MGDSGVEGQKMKEMSGVVGNVVEGMLQRTNATTTKSAGRTGCVTRTRHRCVSVSKGSGRGTRRRGICETGLMGVLGTRN